jgi:hypothetical protein
MSDKPLDELYLQWLYSNVLPVSLKNPSRTYWALLRQLYCKEFVWFIPNDDNRVEDGRDLRAEFFRESGEAEFDPGWSDLGCSMLEMLIALSRRLSFDVEGEPSDWFWHLLENLELRECNDRSKYSPKDVDEILDRVIWRNYNYNGQGGLFPLTVAVEDQRKVEIWYQLSAYLSHLFS